MSVTLDMFEYPDSAAAQAAWVSSDAATATFGETDKLGTQSSRAANYINITKFTSGKAATLESISLYIEYQSADANIKCAIYDSSLNLLTNGTTESHLITSGQDGWKVFNFSTPPAVAASTVYWLAFWNDAAFYGYRGAGTTNQFGYKSQAYDGWPATLVPDAYQDYVFSIHANYTAPCLQCYSESTIKQEGSYSLKGLAKATDSLNDTLTRSGLAIDLSGQLVVKFEVRASRTGNNFKIGIHDAGGVTTEHAVIIYAANTWQTEYWDISTVIDANKDAIDSIILTITNADADNTFYIDNMFGTMGRFFVTHQ